MLAYQLVEWQQPPELREVDVPEPGPGEVLVKVGGAGACHSDLHVMEWPAGALPYELPFTLGHENAGWIESVGAGRRRGRVRTVGLRALPLLPHDARDAVRAPSRDRRLGRRARPRRRHGR